MFRYITIIKITLKSMAANKMRTALTVLGMVIGIASVIIVYSAGAGIEGLIVGQVESFGTDIIETEIKVPTNSQKSNASTEGAAALAQGAQITTLTLDDMEDVNELPNIAGGYGGIMGQELASYGNERNKVFILGVSSSYIDIDQSEIESGRFFTDSEDKSLSQVVVLGSKIKENFFGDSDAMGKSIKLGKKKFKVIGIMKERGAVMTMDFDNYVYMPVRTAQKRLLGINHVLYMVHQLEDLDMAEETAEDIRYLLRDNHDIEYNEGDDFAKDDFRVVTMTEMMDMLGTITGALTLLLLAIVVISLVVGGVGILNIMYVVVSERTPEIGLRKAVGARYSDIMSQFLIESILISIIGGIAGAIIGSILSYLVSIGASSTGLDWEFSLPLKSYFVAIGFSTFFGVVFGVYPARKAARLEPVEALRNE